MKVAIADLRCARMYAETRMMWYACWKQPSQRLKTAQQRNSSFKWSIRLHDVYFSSNLGLDINTAAKESIRFYRI